MLGAVLAAVVSFGEVVTIAAQAFTEKQAARRIESNTIAIFFIFPSLIFLIFKKFYGNIVTTNI
jgi:phosphate starvation-inducible membrane PsiE